MSRYQPIYDIAELCARKGANNVVLCPGSRCAPLTIAFTRHPKINKRTLTDERSAAFVAIGLAQQTKAPSVLVCTSGSAAYNFAPGVAEAYFSQTPLLIITADRPPEWIAQHDGQTIHQHEIFGKHVKKSFSLPVDYDHPDSLWAINRIVNEAINLSIQEPAGPVHINAPFREPLYPKSDAAVTFSEEVRVMEELPSVYSLTTQQKEFLASSFSKYNNILIVAGQSDYDSTLLSQASLCMMSHALPLVGDVISNFHSLEDAVRYADLFLSHAPEDTRKMLRPDLLITFGKSVISKNLKLFLRKMRPSEHWHFQCNDIAADTFQTATHTLHVSPGEAFEYLASLPRANNFDRQKQENYRNLWQAEDRRTKRTLSSFFPLEELSELETVREVMENLPPECNLHLANSMSVRYANIVGLRPDQRGVRVYSNRGTSGIDGCTSTAVGHALADGRPNVLITGDLAFFYDRNAFWHNYPLPNLRVVVLNNHGGIIFGMIDGPGSLPEADEFFITRQPLSARHLCGEFGIDYLRLDNKRKMKNLLTDFFEFEGRTKILEAETVIDLNKTIFGELKYKIKNSYES